MQLFKKAFASSAVGFKKSFNKLWKDSKGVDEWHTDKVNWPCALNGIKFIILMGISKICFVNSHTCAFPLILLLWDVSKMLIKDERHHWNQNAVLAAVIQIQRLYALLIA